MDQDTKRVAVDFLRLAKTEQDAAQERQLRSIRNTVVLVTAARNHGLTWDEIASALGHPNGHAVRMWYRRSGGGEG